MKAQTLAAAVALLGLSSPGAAADLVGQEPPSRLGLFAGGTIRMSLDERSPAPLARFSFGSYRLTDRQTGPGVRIVQPRGLEFGQGEAGKPMIFVGGQPMPDLQRRLRLSGSSDTLLWIGGAVAVGVIALLLLSHGEDDCCLDPNLCSPCD